MKNYLKKAISAVIALALAASMVPATFAAKLVLTDVPETADYATAVNTLVALKVIDGYEDNSFKPDNQITRAEASKVIVAALNEIASAEAMKGATKFADIEAKHEWATGYINKGVSMGYINGMENNQFQPDGNVTYAQIVKMMLCAMGYEDYAKSLAEQYGYTGANWYVPYTQLAADAGVTDGVYAGPNEAVTRAQVAQLVYNAIQAPIVKNTGVTYTDSGKLVPRIQIQDGEQSTYFKSILTEKFDAYYVEGYVIATSKDSSNLDTDEVSFGIAKSKKYDEEVVYQEVSVNNMTAASATSRLLSVVNVGDTEAADNKAVYATAIVMLDEYDDWKLLSFTPSGKNKTVTFDVKDFDEDELDATAWATVKTSSAPYLRFFVDDAKTSTKFALATDDTDTLDVTVYVNGIKSTDADPILAYVINGDVGEITLVDTYKTDGKYDTIYVEDYISFMVDSVSSNGKIQFQDAPDGVDVDGILSLTIDEEDTTKTYNIYYNGEEITVDQLQKDDVLTIAYNVEASNVGVKEAFNASTFYEIYVSREVVSDTLRGKKDEDYAARLGDPYYDFADAAHYNEFKTATLGDEYTFYLDAFGRVFKSDINSSAANWGIAEKFTAPTGADDDYKLTVFTADGTTKGYFFDDTRAKVTKADGTTLTTTGDDLIDDLKDLVYESGTTRNDLEDRVIQYKVSTSTGKITSVKFVAIEKDTLSGTDGKQEFKSKNGRIGSIYLGEATKVVDATDYSDKKLATTTVAGLTDGINYKAYAYGEKIGDIHPFVLITEGVAGYNEDSRVAVLKETGYSEEEDEEGNTVYSIAALTAANDDTKKLIVSDEYTGDLDDLKAGDVFYYITDEKGYIEEIAVIFSAGEKLADHETLAAASLVNENKDNANLTGITVESTFGGKFDSKFTNKWIDLPSDVTEPIRLVYGPIVERTSSDITFAIIDDNGETDLEEDEELVSYDFAKDVNVYTYDFAQSSKYALEYAGSQVTSIVASTLYPDSDEVVDWNEMDGEEKINHTNANFAFAVVVDNLSLII